MSKTPITGFPHLRMTKCDLPFFRQAADITPTWEKVVSFYLTISLILLKNWDSLGV
jgi:hypothetical protein